MKLCMPYVIDFTKENIRLEVSFGEIRDIL